MITAVYTAIAQPKVITIHPPLLPLVLLSTTFATTPSPNMMSIAVPINSPRKGLMLIFFKVNDEGERREASGKWLVSYLPLATRHSPLASLTANNSGQAL